MLEAGTIESGMRRAGAEQEVFLVDRHWQPASLAGAHLAGVVLARLEGAGRERGPGDWIRSHRTVRQVMSKELLTVQPEDLLDLATSVTEWELIRHAPVDDGKLIGIVTEGNFIAVAARLLRDELRGAR